jgi:HmuY protein
MRKVIISILLFILFTASSCFQEDERVDPHVPGEGVEFILESSIYDNQIYFDFNTGSVLSEVPNDAWTLAFGAGPDDWQIRINSGGLYGAYPSGFYKFEDVVSVTTASLYHFDASSGDPDSSAFSSWIDRTGDEPVPTNEIFLIAKFDGIKYTPEWKIRIDSVNTSAFYMSYSSMSGTVKSFEIHKDYGRNFVHVKMEASPQIVQIEPLKTDWDLLFSQYGTIIPDDEGTPTPYFVRGVLINPYLVEVSSDTAKNFEDIIYDDFENYSFFNTRDYIGYDWKDVEIDLENNTAVYKVRTDISWLIKASSGYFVKMRFVNFYNNQGLKGYPGFEYVKL